MNGMILLDKPTGKTSFDADKFIRRISSAKKVGHLGTLDPFATGLLPVFLGTGLKMIRYCEGFDKTYVCTAKFGAATDSMDVDGEIINRHEFTEEELNKLREEDFKTIRDAFEEESKTEEQMPPKFSAKKIDGKKAYELAREGRDDILEQKLKPHKIKIYSLSSDEINLEGKDLRVTFTVHCSAGTYIRTIADNVGRRTGFFAYAESLRRIGEGDFKIEDSYTFEQIEKMAEAGDFSFIKPAEDAIGFMPEVIVDAKVADDLSHGKKNSRDKDKRN